MRIAIVGLGIVIGLGLCLTLASAQKPAASRAADEAAIRKAIDTYAAAMNKGDIETITAFWASDAEFVNESGKVTRGKTAIAELFKKSIADNKGATFKVRVTSLRFLKPDLALQDGTVEVTDADGGADRGRYTAVWTKADDRWQILSVRDLAADVESEASPAEPNLKQLEWLVGNWLHEDSDASVALSCRWAHRQSFLFIEQVI